MYSVLQKSQHTTYNRYPLTFSFIKVLMPEPLRILSFGCSTGLELKSLKELYFPNAIIEGCDIDFRCVQETKKKRFNCFEPEKLSEQQNYDIIFANSVLCCWNSTDNPLQTPVDFNTFAQACRLLDSKLNLGGILCTINSNYYVDTVLSNYIELEPNPGLYTEIEKVSVFSPQGQFLGKNRRVIWRKNS